MAQPVFDEHPLEDYFRDSGEDVDIMPGGDFQFASELPAPSSRRLGSFRLLSAVVQLLQLVRSQSHTDRHTNAFAERFKYNVISSSLLSSEVATTQFTHHRSSSPHIPGRLASSHHTSTIDPEPSHSSPIFDSFTDSHWPATLSCMAALAFVTGNFVLFALLSSTTLVFFHISRIDKSVRPEVVVASFDSLDELITAGNIWDSAVNEAITILENDERSIFYGPTSAASPASSLRVALQSSLHTTQNQCDNVRQLFSALTSPSELAPLSEMYAPPSPIKTTFDSQTVRPKSMPGIRRRNASLPSNKRATWNGSYATLAQAGSPTMQIFRRREKRRSDLSGLRGMNLVMSAPATPNLEGLKEEKESVAGSKPPGFTNDDTFGVAALDLCRKHRHGGLDALRRPDYAAQQIPSPSSRFTLMQTSRHPLSLSALNLALQGALAAKRYACSHLLALRFDEEEEYWEDVRSVMALLTSTLVDASSRLMEALDEAEKKRIKDEIPSSASESLSRETSIEPSSPSISHLRSSSWSSQAVEVEKKRFRTMEQMVSFAPVPSHLARFAAHVDALSSALNNARDNLEQCVVSLRDGKTNNPPSAVLPPHLNDAVPQNISIEAYDRLRKELGLALRECERGREQLLEVVHAGRSIGSESEDVEDAPDEDDVPALGHDTGTDESEDRIPESLSALMHSTIVLATATAVPGLDEDETYPDDATAHLLLTASSHHLPPIGAEQVFEAETAPDSGVRFTRERSKLTRDERIELAKARRDKRESARLHHQHEGDGEGSPVERVIKGLGPGGEVVQELKDVIWQVGERKRKMAEQLLLSSSTPSSEDTAPRRIPSPFTRLDS